MKTQIIISLSLIWGLLSCNLDKKTPTSSKANKKNVRIFKPPGKYYTDFNDEKCKQQIDSAKNDIKKGKLVYEDSRGWVKNRYDDEMKEILNEYGINYQKTGPNCTLEQECYGFFMDSIISQRFGKNFIKHIEKRADSLFLSRWKTKTYESWDIDERPFYRKDIAELYIREKIKFPKNWDTIPMKFARQYIVVDAFISNKGKLTNWEFQELYNLKESNEQFLPEIKKQINQIMKGMTEWNPGKLMGKDVNSTIWLDINLDRESRQR